MPSTLFPAHLRAKLLANGARSGAGEDIDPVPVVKLFTPDANATWLLTEIDPDNEDVAFGLCDLGLGCPELGSVSLTEMLSVRGRLGLPVERDQHFVEKRPISAIAKLARQKRQNLDDRRHALPESPQSWGTHQPPPMRCIVGHKFSA